MAKTVAIVGGGISGLSAAYYLERARRAGADVHYTLFEATSRLGGVMWTEHVNGCLVEAGPDSFLSEKASAAVLCRDLGIDDQLVGSNDALRKTYILVKGRLVPIPDGLMFMVPTKLLPTLASPLFSFGTKLRMAREFFARPVPSQRDESVAAFVERHFGAEVVDRLADPLLSGVYGGDARQLSVRAVLPRFLEMENKHGSLSRAMLAAMKKRPATGGQHSSRLNPGISKNGVPCTLFTAMREGMQQLVDGLVMQLERSSLRTATGVSALGREPDAWLVHKADGATERFDHVIVATPAYIAAELLRSVYARLSSVLDQIAYSSSVTVAAGYDAAAFNGRVNDKPLDGFGFLVPRTEGRRIMACTYVHNKFPHRAPPERFLLRVFLGGSKDEAVLALSDHQLLASVRDDLRSILGLTTEPLFTRLYRWKRSMAQYRVGHLERVAEIGRLRSKIPGLALVGNAYSGIGVPDCIRTGMDAATEIVKR